MSYLNTNGHAANRPNGDYFNGINNKVNVVLGSQWGDEGKGKIIDMLATEAHIVCRCQVCEVAI